MRRRQPDDIALGIIYALEKLADDKITGEDRVTLVNLLKNSLSFNSLCESSWRVPNLNMISSDLRQIWHALPLREKYELWCNRFNTKERVRLWNGIVFQTGWFTKIGLDGTQIKKDVEKVIVKIK